MWLLLFAAFLGGSLPIGFPVLNLWLPCKHCTNPFVKLLGSRLFFSSDAEGNMLIMNKPKQREKEHVGRGFDFNSKQNRAREGNKVAKDV